MDWQLKGEEKLENLPRQEQIRRDDRDRYYGYNFPYKRLYRWLESKVGQPMDKVISEYCHADWVPVEFRSSHELAKYVETNTYLQKFGKIMRVCYHDRWSNDGRRVDESGSQILYVDPVSFQLRIYIPPTRESYLKKEQKERDAKVKILGPYHQLYKENGIWYEIKGEDAGEMFILCPRFAPNDILRESPPRRYSNLNIVYPRIKITLRRQLNSKELKKHGLKNGPFFLDPSKLPEIY